MFVRLYTALVHMAGIYDLIRADIQTDDNLPSYSFVHKNNKSMKKTEEKQFNAMTKGQLNTMGFFSIFATQKAINLCLLLDASMHSSSISF